MTTIDFIPELFCRVDDRLGNAKHPPATLYAGEIVTPALPYTLKGCGQRAFWRWLQRDYQPLFPPLPERTRLLSVNWV